MAYIKNNWVDREGTTRYFETVDDDGALIFTPDYTQVTELGTPVNADNMNHIEEGIEAGSFTKYDTKATYVLNDLVTVIEDASPTIYKSLQDNNIGKALSDTTYWEKISLGGGGGLEIGDIGIAPLGIDETKGKRRYLNGQLIIQEQYVQFTDKVKSAVALYPTLACTESEWQTTATMTVGGQVGKFVVDDEAGTIRLPKIIMPIQGLTDLSKLGEIVKAGLPQLTTNSTGAHTHYEFSNQVNGTSKDSKTEQQLNNSSQVTSLWYDGYAAYNMARTSSAANVGKSSSAGAHSHTITGTATTVQQEQIQYPYFIQVATGAETEDNIINEIELNNPFFYGMSQYFKMTPNNISWLKSEGQYNTKAVYTAYYEWLLKIYNGVETVEGISVLTVDEEYTDYDFVLNLTDETFRLPLKNGQEGMFGGSVAVTNSAVSVYGNGKSLGVTSTGSNIMSLAWNGAYACYSPYKSGNLAQTVDSVTNGSMDAIGVSKNASQSGLTGSVTSTAKYTASTTAPAGWFLYYYVGETVQNANLINAGRIEEKFADCITRLDCPAYIVETYVNGTSWYRVYSDGWKEQGGIISIAAYTTSTNSTVTFLKPFANANYSAVLQVANGGNSWAKISTNSTSRTATTMVAAEYQTDGTGASIAAHKLIWYAYGY